MIDPKLDQGWMLAIDCDFYEEEATNPFYQPVNFFE